MQVASKCNTETEKSKRGATRSPPGCASRPRSLDKQAIICQEPEATTTPPFLFFPPPFTACSRPGPGSWLS